MMAETVTQKCHSIRDIIIQKRIIPYFQPIVALKTGELLGVEALSRGLDEQHELVAPDILFSYADLSGMTTRLDRLCRDKALHVFNEDSKLHPHLFLFLNIDVSIFDKGNVDYDYLINSVRQHSLDPSRVVIELTESKIHNIDMLRTFIRYYKNMGFLIALDDVGVGFSNLDRVLLAEPDIIKIDRCMVNESIHNQYKRETITSLVNMAKRIGAITVGEGIETEAEALSMCELGVDLAQGFYFNRPQPSIAQCFSENLFMKVNQVRQSFKAQEVERIALEDKMHHFYEEISQGVAQRLAVVSPELFEEEIVKMRFHEAMEYVYVLNDEGIQVTNSIGSIKPHGSVSRIFGAAQKASDQSSKSYFLNIKAGKRIYSTNPYLSYASANLSITIAVLYTATDARHYILCIDFSYPY